MRAFNKDGKAKEPFEEPKDTVDRQKEEPRADSEKQEAPPLPEVNFSSFLLSLSSSVLLHLGEIPDPQSGEKKKDMVLAKQSIDIIGLLKDKTKGNLTEEEKKLLEKIVSI